jgi:nucleoid-associated protein YgaU
MVSRTEDTGARQGESDFVGQTVRVEKAGAVLRVGQVEAVTGTGEILWIKASGCDARAMYGPAFGHRVYQVKGQPGSSH